MSGKATAVMWMGILLIVTRLFTTGQIHDLTGIFQSGTVSGPRFKVPKITIPQIPTGGKNNGAETAT